MNELVENTVLDTENIEFNNAADFIRHTNRLVYLTGKAGTGKTTFLKYIKNSTNKNTVVLAPTGIAAINAGGTTIHSFFQMPFGPFLPNDFRLSTVPSNENIYTTFKYTEDKREIINKLELLIIDEVSMVRCDTLDVIDTILKVFRKKPHLPFGGVQVVLIGDTFQLPPVTETNLWEILSQFYNTQFFFSSKVLENNAPVYIELKKIYRQNEREFIDILNKVRVNQIEQRDLSLLNSKYNPSFSGNGSDYIILATTNKIVQETNLNKLEQLNTEEFVYTATVEGTFPDGNKPTDQNLKLKVGAQIMFIKNDTGSAKKYYNGKIGKIETLKDDEITVVFDDDSKVKVERSSWHNIKYSFNKEKKKIEEEIIGTFRQFPLKLAWAITVHKSQGLTFDKVIADLGNAFASGQVYVALSRCTSFNGLVLKTQLNRNAIKTDRHVLEFAKNETPSTLVVEHLNTGRADFNYQQAREQFKNGNHKAAIDAFRKALKYRNDFETDIFTRYFITQSKKLSGYRIKFEKQAQDVISLNKDLTLANTRIESLADKLKAKDQKIKALNKTVSNQDQQISNSEAVIRTLTDKNAALENQLLDAENNIQLLDTKARSLSNQVWAEKEKNKQLLKEIEQLKKKRWYHSLFGG